MLACSFLGFFLNLKTLLHYFKNSTEKNTFSHLKWIIISCADKILRSTFNPTVINVHAFPKNQQSCAGEGSHLLMGHQSDSS